MIGVANTVRSWAIDLYFRVAPTVEIRARARQSSGMQVTFVHGTLLSSMNEDGTGLKTFFNGFNQNNSLHTLQSFFARLILCRLLGWLNCIQ